jgi:hypothetical protein
MRGPGRRPAFTKRTLQFIGGPQSSTFHACWEHAHKLETATLDVSNFMAAPHQDVRSVDASERDDAEQS